MSYIVAITGGIGSGKSTVSNKFLSLGVPVVDSDIIARKILISNIYALDSIKQYFNSNIINNDGSLNRRELRKKIFSNLTEKKWLNNLLHPLIRNETQRQINLFSYSYVVWVVPLLIENNLDHLVNRVLVIDIKPEEQISRIIKRDNISEKDAKNILFNQVSRIKRLQKANDIIDNNNNNKLILDKTILKLHKKYLQLASNVFKQKYIK
ncbi:MAG: dephospho-CoA kinase [Arsenophonus sp.]